MDMRAQLFGEIYERHVSMLYRVCFSYVKNAADAEDIVADVFLKALQRGMEFKNCEHEKAWLLRTAINMCKDNLKHWWRRRESIDDHIGLVSEDPLYEDETLRVVLGLPERYKAAIYLYFYESYSSLEIAGILKSPGPQSSNICMRRENC